MLEAQIKVNHWRVRIINSILTQGVKPRSLLVGNKDFLGSATPPEAGDLPNYVEVIGLDPRWEFNTKRRYEGNIRSALNSGGYSIFPVLMEREGESCPWELTPEELRSKKDLLQDRTQSSCLVVCREFPEDLKGEMKISTTSGLTTHTILRAKGGFQAVRINAIIIPEAVASPIRELIIPTSAELVELQTRRRKRMWGRVFEVPDYEDAIRSVQEELSSSIWIHGVRLPTMEDIKERPFAN